MLTPLHSFRERNVSAVCARAIRDVFPLIQKQSYHISQSTVRAVPKRVDGCQLTIVCCGLFG